MRKKEYGVFGLGKFGMAVAVALAESGNSVIAVDMDPDRVDVAAETVTCAMVADVTEPDVLDNLGISNLDCVIIGGHDSDKRKRRRFCRSQGGE